MISVIVLNPALDKICFIENFIPGNMYRANKIVRSAGGKGINVARVLAKLGGNVFLTGFFGGNTGNWLKKEIECLGIEMNLVWVDGETRTNTNIIDKVQNTETEILEAGTFIRQHNRERFMDIFENALRRTKVLVCTGGLPEGLSQDFYGTLIKKAKDLGIKTILDAGGQALKEGIKEKPDIIKPNLRELSQYEGRELSKIEDVIDVCTKIRDKGVSIIVASLGSKGALMVDGSGVFQTMYKDVEVVNAIGSGDSMVAGMAFGIWKEYSSNDMLKLGTACALSNTQFMEIGVIDRNSVDKYFDQIIIKKLI